MVPEVDNHKKLAHEVRPLFNSQKGQVNDARWRMTTRLHLHCHVFARRISCCHLTPSLPARISGKSSLRRWWHMPRPFSSGCEKADPPTGGKLCLLAGSIVELWEEMKCYMSFSDEDVFNGMALLEESPIISPEEATSKSTQPTLANTPVNEATVDMTMEPAAEKRPPNKFSGWEKVLHPSRPIVTAGQIPPLLRGLRQSPHSQSSGEGLVWIP